MKKIILPLLAVIMAFSSCKKPSGNGSLTLKLNPTFGGTPMKLDTIYSTPDGKYYYFDVFNIYLSHIKLIRADGSFVEVDPLVFITVNDSNKTPTISLGNPSGNFTALQFSIGLDSIQNNVPQDNSNPSSPYYYDNNMYWYTLKYVFLELQGDADTSNPPGTSLGYHIGTNTYYTTVTLNKTITLSGTTSNTLVLNTDIRKIFYGVANPVNVLDPNQQVTSATINASLCQKFITDFDSSFSLQ